MTIDLDAWEVKRRGEIKHAADMAMWRLSQRYGWGIPHPTVSALVKAQDDVAANMRRTMQAFSMWFRPRYDALCKMFAAPKR